MLTIRWGFLPAEVRDAARPLILDYLWLLPTWVHTLSIGYTVTESDPSCTASMTSNPSYRSARLALYGLWLSESPVERRRIIAHEMIHPMNAPLLVATNEIVKLTTEKGSPLYSLGMESIRSASEGATVDFTRAIMALPVCPAPPPYVEEEDEQAPPTPGKGAVWQNA